MTVEAEQIATDWIAYLKYDPARAPVDIFERAWVLYDLVEDDPFLAWAAIRIVVRRYSEEDLLTGRKTEAQHVVGNTAAGPLENLLAAHGSQMIDLVEIEARQDRRMAWTLGGVWQSSMTDEIWARIRRSGIDRAR